MTRILFATFLFAGLCAAQAASAQQPSRLDEVMKSGKLRVCTPGDYKPFSLAMPDGGYEGLDIDLVQSAAKALGVQVEMVKTSWPKLMDDFLQKCDIGVGGISVSTDRAKRAAFSTPYMVNGKAPITRCENVARFQTVADINKPTVTVINPEKPLQYGEMAYLLPRGDPAMKEWMDTWLHLSKANGEFDRTIQRWLK